MLLALILERFEATQLVENGGAPLAVRAVRRLGPRAPPRMHLGMLLLFACARHIHELACALREHHALLASWSSSVAARVCVVRSCCAHSSLGFSTDVAPRPPSHHQLLNRSASARAVSRVDRAAGAASAAASRVDASIGVGPFLSRPWDGGAESAAHRT